VGPNGKAWKPENYDRKFRGPTTLQQAIEESVNIVTVKLQERVGVNHTVQVQKKISDLRVLMRRAESAARGYELYRSQGFYDEFQAVRAQIAPALADLKRGVRDIHDSNIVRGQPDDIPRTKGLRPEPPTADRTRDASRSETRMAPARRLPARMLHAVVDDLAAIVRAPQVGVGILLASVLVVLGHAGVFLVAVRAAGVEVSAVASLPLALVVLLAASIPTSIAGWGPREGIAAWAFAVAGLGAAQGLTVSVVYGVIALVATLPGAVVLVARRRSGRRAAPALAPAAREVAHG